MSSDPENRDTGTPRDADPSSDAMSTTPVDPPPDAAPARMDVEADEGMRLELDVTHPAFEPIPPDVTAPEAPARFDTPLEHEFQTSPEPGFGTSPEPEFASASPEMAPVAPEMLWRSETAATSEGAIVAEATTPFLRQLSVLGDEIFAWIRTLVSAAVWAVIIVTFGFQVARVEGQSMAPTLADKDRLIVNKLAYRLGPPRREDIVMLYWPPDPDKSFVKRVIAEEGQLIKIEDGRVFVNDVPIDDDYVPPEYRSHDDFPPTVVKEGYYFVMGDHRNNSSDSRIWGEVPKKYIIGKVQLRWWPLLHARLF